MLHKSKMYEVRFQKITKYTELFRYIVTPSITLNPNPKTNLHTHFINFYSMTSFTLSEMLICLLNNINKLFFTNKCSHSIF